MSVKGESTSENRCNAAQYTELQTDALRFLRREWQGQ